MSTEQQYPARLALSRLADQAINTAGNDDGVRRAVAELQTVQTELDRLNQALADEERIRDAHKRHLDELRDETLRSQQMKQLHETAKAYVDVRNAYEEMFGGPLSTTVGYLIRWGFLVRSDVDTHQLIVAAELRGRRSRDAEVDQMTRALAIERSKGPDLVLDFTPDSIALDGDTDEEADTA